jgi:hypothetical protein
MTLTFEQAAGLVDRMLAVDLITAEKKDETIQNIMRGDDPKQLVAMLHIVETFCIEEMWEKGAPVESPPLLPIVQGLSLCSKNFSPSISGGRAHRGEYLQFATRVRAWLPYMTYEPFSDVPSRWYAHRMCIWTSLYARAEGRPPIGANYISISQWYLEKAQARAVELATALAEEEKGLRPRATYLDVLPESEQLRDLLAVEVEYDYEEISAPKHYTGAAAGRSILKKPVASAAASAELSGRDVMVERVIPTPTPRHTPS